MSLPAGVRLQTREGFTVLNPTPRNHHPVNIGGGINVTTTGKEGVCILPNGTLVPGIEVLFDNMSPPELTIPLTIVKVLR
jgi:hypothetical protein